MTPPDLVEQRLRQLLGRHDDLPTELVDAARVVAREALALESQGNPFRGMPDSGDFRADFLALNARFARLSRNLLILEGTVPLLRQLRHEAPEEYAFELQVVIDVVKYNIANAQSKPPLLRAVERTLKRLLGEV